MATFKPGRLRRTLDPIVGTGWLFAMYTPSYSAYEDVITSVTITRGTNGRNVGHNPTTIEIGYAGRYDTLTTGEQQRVFLREAQGTALATFLGCTYADIMYRYQGRLGVIDVDDTGKLFHTTTGGSSWLTQMNFSPASFTPTAGESLNSLYLDMTKADSPARGIDFGTALGVTNVSHFAAGESTLFKSGLGDFVEDIGVMFQERRDGSTLSYSHSSRNALANTRLATEYPLMRHQAISPGKYKQSNERPAKRIEYTIYNETGGLATRVAEIENPTGELRETEQVDWSRWQVHDVDNQLNREAYARVFDSSARLYQVPTITVDLLHLIRRGNTYAKQIAKQMLMLEVGEPIFLSGDWPPRIQGVHFAEGIKETIAKDEWTIELSLVPSAAAIGYTSPEVAGRAWDSVNTSWNSQTKKWNEF